MRLDNYLVQKGFFDSRTKAKQSIERKEIFVNDKLVTKVSFEIDINDENIKIKKICQDSFVSLGGYKIKKALVDFNFNVAGLVCADMGASTGGFTDCLIKEGAKKVYSIDLNDKLLHNSLKNNSNVFQIIKNVKDLSKKDFSEKLDLIVADLSFISITQALPIFSKLLDDKGALIVLIKPQFEVGIKKKFKNGIIKDKKIQLEACYNAYNCASQNLLCPIAFTTAPISENKNVEFLMLFIKNAQNKMDISQIKF